VESSILQAGRASALSSFSGLSPDERAHLKGWQAAARSVGVDGIEDLAGRPWPCPVNGSVIGIFRRGSNAAVWLVIGQNAAWAVATCADGTVSQPLHSLAEALATIYPGRPDGGSHSSLC
jgi:hypothetical protein